MNKKNKNLKDALVEIVTSGISTKVGKKSSSIIVETGVRVVQRKVVTQVMR